MIREHITWDEYAYLLKIGSFGKLTNSEFLTQKEIRDYMKSTHEKKGHFWRQFPMWYNLLAEILL